MFRDLSDEMTCVVLTVFRTVRIANGLFDPGLADVPFSEHFVEMSGIFHK